MDAKTEPALSVVAVMVVHRPTNETAGAWDAHFEEVLLALAGQDYPNVKTLFLVAGDAGDVPATIRSKVPGAFVRAVAGNPGYGAAANEVLRLVEGDNGFFLLLHDDVVLEPGATRALVEELYRSHAGIVGPKLVMWNDHRMLQHVGLGVDRFGEVDPLVEPGEIDQEQHDAVRDVFALPSACLLVRADLFRALGGFDPAISFHGDDIDLCWRAHLSGARVVVVPTARARHREGLRQRRTDLSHPALAARHRVRTVATLTSGLRLPLVLVQMLLISIAEMVVGLFTGRLGEAFASCKATFGLVAHTGSVVKRRRQIAPLRQVPYREVAGLQIRGSARLASYLRTREQSHMAVDSSAVGASRFTRNAAGQIGAWCAVIVLVLVGSRQFIGSGVPAVGQFLGFPDSTRHLLGDYWSGWWSHGLGQTASVPTAIGLLGVSGVVSLGHMGLFHTVAVLGWLPFGYLGAWKLMSIFPSSRARIVGFIAFASVPLPYSALGAGRWGVLAAYGAAPWVVHYLRRVARVEPALASRADADVADARGRFDRREIIRDMAKLSLVGAVVTAFVPVFGIIVVLIGVTLALATLVARGESIVAACFAAAAVVAALIAALVNLPWFSSLFGANGWDNFVGAPTATSAAASLTDVLRFDIGPSTLGVLSVALWVPVLIAPILARGWRLTWAGRGAALATVSLLLAMLAAHRSGPIRLPEIGLLLTPAAVGIALAAACTTAAFEQDVRGGDFGWRQPLGLLGGAALVLGAIPAIAATADGAWSTPTDALSRPADQLAVDPLAGDSRTLFVGDARLMPVDAWRLDDAGESGMAYAIVDDGQLTVAENWAGVASDAERDVAGVLELIATNATARAGRLLAPYAIRYVVIPVADGLASSADNPIELPAGLLASLGNQLDFRRQLSPPTYLAFENTAWVPTQSMLSAAAAAESNKAGPEALASIQIAGSQTVLTGMPERGPGVGPVEAGVLHLAKPFDERWTLTVDGSTIAPRPAFGTSMVFDVPAAGTAELAYGTSASRRAAVVVQALAWLALLLAASSVNWSWLRRRPRAASIDGPVLDIGVRDSTAAPWILAPGMPASSNVGPRVAVGSTADGRADTDDDLDTTVALHRPAIPPDADTYDYTHADTHDDAGADIDVTADVDALAGAGADADIDVDPGSGGRRDGTDTEDEQP